MSFQERQETRCVCFGLCTVMISVQDNIDTLRIIDRKDGFIDLAKRIAPNVFYRIGVQRPFRVTQETPRGGGLDLFPIEEKKSKKNSSTIASRIIKQQLFFIFNSKNHKKQKNLTFVIKGITGITTWKQWLCESRR